MGLTQREQQEVASANESGRQPVMFVHGLWLLAGSWDAWRGLFEERGYATVGAGMAGRPRFGRRGAGQPGRLRRQGGGRDHRPLRRSGAAARRPPAIIGHSFGGLITQKLAGEGLAAAAVAIDPAPIRGVLALPAVDAEGVVPGAAQPGQQVEGGDADLRAVALRVRQRRRRGRGQGAVRAVPRAGAGRPLFQAAFANFNPKAETAVDTSNATRGPLLIVSGEVDHIVPKAVAHGAYKRYGKSAATTEFVEMAGRGHSLALDSGWREVADTALAFLEKSGVGPS